MTTKYSRNVTECEFSSDTLRLPSTTRTLTRKKARMQGRLYSDRGSCWMHTCEMYYFTATRTDEIPPPPAVMARLDPVVPRAPEEPTPAAPIPVAPRCRARTPERRPRERETLRPQPYRRPNNHGQRAVPPPPRWQPRTPGGKHLHLPALPL